MTVEPIDIARLRELAEAAMRSPVHNSQRMRDFKAECTPERILALLDDLAIANEHADACERAMKLAEAHALAERKKWTALLLPIIQAALGMKSRADHGTTFLRESEINAALDALREANEWPYRVWERAALHKGETERG